LRTHDFIFPRYICLVIFLLHIHTGLCASSGRSATVTVEPVLVQDIIDDLEIIGTIQAKRKSLLDVETAGLISEVHFYKGQYVEKGKRLISLNDEAISIKILASNAILKALKAEKEFSKKRMQRSQALFKKQHMTQEAYESDVLQFTRNDLKHKQQQAETDLLKWQKEKHLVKAPFTGLIQKEYASIGDWIQPGQPFASLLNLTHVYAEFEVPEKYISKLNRKETVTMHADAWTAKIFTAKLEAILPGKMEGGRSVLCRYLIANPEQLLLPGMSIKSHLKMMPLLNAILVPKDALVHRGATPIIFLEIGGKAREVKVKLLG